MARIPPHDCPFSAKFRRSKAQGLLDLLDLTAIMNDNAAASSLGLDDRGLGPPVSPRCAPSSPGCAPTRTPPLAASLRSSPGTVEGH
jgi:hypothetical protein